jgi:uncharacterized Zn finger protein (UPF0148 family)
MAEELCPSCGTPYESGGTFCINCGAKREEAKKGEAGEAAGKPPQSEKKPRSEPADKGRKARKKKAAEETRPSDDDVLERLEKSAGVVAEPKAEETKPPAPEAKEPEAAPAPPAPTPPVGDEPGAPPPTEPKKKSKKGCCIAIVVVGVLFIVAAVIGVALYYAGVFDDLTAGGGGAGFSHDFELVTEEDFAVWQTGPETLVKPEKGMLKIKNALVGVNHDPGTNYTATCVIFVQSVESDSGWAGLSARVNPKGGDRYSFEILPATKIARIRKIAGKGEPLVLATSRVPALKVGAPFTVAAGVSGSDLTMEVNGTVVGRATDIGLITGPTGFEVRGATAYFDDLSVETE